MDSLPKGRINADRLDATTEANIAVQQHNDESAALQDAAKFARRVRRRLGMSQVDFPNRINVPIDTIRNWEQGKRSPTGAAKTLLKVLDKAPGAAKKSGASLNSWILQTLEPRCRKRIVPF